MIPGHCSTCQTTFSSLALLVQHEATEHGDQKAERVIVIQGKKANRDFRSAREALYAQLQEEMDLSSTEDDEKEAAQRDVGQKAGHDAGVYQHGGRDAGRQQHVQPGAGNPARQPNGPGNVHVVRNRQG